ncbi:class I adenylate-forming enzyme family protein [Haladaptatus sp. DJG-WS-42]|uniref:class I adenylate-forming enzyme family protein n=1 Tax=Haladaptatus sp. DJG-WS-42 TaxID=3120516 RepID=UPI0030CE05BD
MNFANVVDRAAGNAPVKPAVSDTETLHTYATLADRTNAAANAYEALGVAPGDRVAICLRNSLELLTAYLGAMKCGAIPVPINTQFGPSKICHIFDVSDVSVVVTDEAFADVATDVATPISVGGSVGHAFHDLLADADTEYAVHPRRSDELAEVFYTSGTTGQPKGVHHTHGNLLSNAHGIINALGLTRQTVGLTVCQCFHVTGLNVTTTPLLLSQATNHLLSAFDPERVLATIENSRVTYTFLTPSMLIDLIDDSRLSHYDISSLELVGVGGAPLPKGRFTEAETALDCAVLEGYGMTETTPLAAFNRPDPHERKPGSVGPPTREVVSLRIEDLETGERVGQGERGELLWAGDTVTPGYERPQNDRKAFVERDGTRWLRSGDIGWLDDDGHLFIVDRREDMFTTGCANIYPREIEDVLYDIEGVAAAAIIDARDDLRGAVVTAIITRSGDLSRERIREACAAALDEHEVPQRIEFVDEIPQTTTGKVNRVALRESYGG